MKITRDEIEVLVWIAGLVAVIATLKQYKLNKDQLSFSVLTHCKGRYQSLLPLLSSEDAKERRVAQSRFVDLCNEIIVYIKGKYIPKEIADELIERMVYHLPQFDFEGNNLNNDSVAVEIVESGILREYPKIMRAFRVSNPYDLSDETARMYLIERIRSNIDFYLDRSEPRNLA